jgi:hypothetical protein
LGSSLSTYVLGCASWLVLVLGHGDCWSYRVHGAPYPSLALQRLVPRTNGTNGNDQWLLLVIPYCCSKCNVTHLYRSELDVLYLITLLLYRSKLEVIVYLLYRSKLEMLNNNNRYFVCNLCLNRSKLDIDK